MIQAFLLIIAFENCPLKPFAYFVPRETVFVPFSFLRACYSLDINPLLDKYLANILSSLVIFLHSIHCFLYCAGLYGCYTIPFV